MIITLRKDFGKALAIAKKCTFAVMILLAPCLWAQDFTVTAVPSPESCEGTGSLALSVQNAQPGAVINYKVYLLPDTTNAVWNSSDPNVMGQQSGDYLVIATQLIGGEPFGPTAEDEATITNEVVNLEVGFEAVNAVCGSDGQITVTTIAGNPVMYQITGGPVTTPAQASNVFTALPAGSYNIKVFDNCGNAPVFGFTLLSDAPIVALQSVSFPDTELPACDQLTVTAGILPGNNIPISFPITFTYTVFPPDGSDPLVYTQVISSDPNGPAPGATGMQIIPFYYGEDYSVEVEVTDSCGETQSFGITPVTAVFTVPAGANLVGCGDNQISLTPFKFRFPITIEFTEDVPDGFDPEDFNLAHPGPFMASPIYYGEEGNSMPPGDYTFIATDDCGRTYESTFNIPEPPEPTDPFVTVVAAECITGLGEVYIQIAGKIIASAIIIEANTDVPGAYPNPLPDEVADGPGVITMPSGKLEYVGIPPGTYVIILTDDCGYEYDPVEFTIESAPMATLYYNARPGCGEGFGSMRVFNLPSDQSLTSLFITDGPPAFTNNVILPLDISANIIDGDLYMDNLPPGTYTVDGSTTCTPDTNPLGSIVITGYEATENNNTYIPKCGGVFDLDVHHASNATNSVQFCLQQWNEDLGAWVNPETGEVYSGGAITTEDVLITNNELNINFAYPSGDYRILKTFKAFGNGSDGNKEVTCTDEIFLFTHYDELEIINISIVSCGDNVGDVIVEAVGVDVTYTIIEKDGEPFVIENGSNNVFTGLESAIYKLIVSDDCGADVTRTFNIANLPSTVSATQPGFLDELELCDEGKDNEEIFDLSVQEDDIIDGQEDVEVTYHASQEDAESGANPLPEMYETGTAIIYARVTYLPDPLCYATTSFQVTVHEEPVLEMQTFWGMCEGEEVTIIADPGYQKYTWSTGETTESITVDETGSYTLTVQDDFGCETSLTIEVETSSGPEILSLDVVDWTWYQNSIVVNTMPNPNSDNFEYSIDGGATYQQSPVFDNLPAGIYEVMVRDVYGCGFDEESTYILAYPKFFTPNGDGINETWRIPLAMIVEPDLKVYIYDRYGKLITGFGANHIGWDGTYNGERLPSTDYWFVVIRQNGKEYKGHFSMIR